MGRRREEDSNIGWTISMCYGLPDPCHLMEYVYDAKVVGLVTFLRAI
ncbi:MAG: hypothetical protein ACODAD_08365 [Planctomycetota bacterium]